VVQQISEACEVPVRVVGIARDVAEGTSPAWELLENQVVGKDPDLAEGIGLLGEVAAGIVLKLGGPAEAIAVPRAVLAQDLGTPS
jgi:hypothetical protein